ncbi:copper-transporting P-type ATPase [bacterium BMS3Abin05]|nr:copper-transporting P-type ATPase [bacterium BMS3Abin05]GBE28763.1 copper-transporting P-type ATPase [bacterium BMS3Bbin03]HDK36393.1 YHS domain-containing protein [Bacteroidota bacterium]HDL78511.1 YHS domain-containing protein [Bacteroidota bacterium]HDZ12407.1 YHS domain-containing protein [Bacteroidota bacterium]
MTKDPVCGMEIDESKANEKSEFEDKTYYFCSSGCKNTFDKEPGKYAQKADDTSMHHHHH